MLLASVISKQESRTKLKVFFDGKDIWLCYMVPWSDWLKLACNGPCLKTDGSSSHLACEVIIRLVDPVLSRTL